MTDTVQILRILDFRQVDVRLDHGRLVGHSRRGAIPPDVAAVITHNREALIAHLAEEERLAETVTNALALTDVKYRQWRGEVLAGNDDLALDWHDREALRRVAHIKRRVQPVEEATAA